MAQHDLLINWSPQETRVALIEQGAVQEVLIERAAERGLVGNIYLGRVQRVLPGMQSAFIDIGLERSAFLHVGDLIPHGPARSGMARAGEEAPPVPIERQVFEGQAMLVQVLKDPIGSKGARLTGQISIAGRLLVYLPLDDHIGVSQKIPPAQREAMRQRLAALVGEGARGGYILRTNAEEATDEELADDIAYLGKTWAHIRERAQQVAPPALLYEELTLAQRVLRDLATPATRSIQIDAREQFAALQAFAREYTPQVLERLQLYRGERPIFEPYHVDEEIERALDRRVDLKSGGYLIIDQTEALTTIDVNTGAYVGARNFDDTVFRTNLEAAQAIARQLRLRNLGGIIVIDFIDMVREDHREAVLTELRKQLGRDRVKTMVGGFSQLGLVEMTRKRTRESLAQMLTEPCPACRGRGRVRTARTVCYDILREILREARAFNPREFRIVAAPQVVERFLDEESQHLAGLSDFIGKPISLQSDGSMTQEQYDIVLL
jgi:ribonuclease G